MVNRQSDINLASIFFKLQCGFVKYWSLKNMKIDFLSSILSRMNAILFQWSRLIDSNISWVAAEKHYNFKSIFYFCFDHSHHKTFNLIKPRLTVRVRLWKNCALGSEICLNAIGIFILEFTLGKGPKFSKRLNFDNCIFSRKQLLIFLLFVWHFTRRN